MRKGAKRKANQARGKAKAEAAAASASQVEENSQKEAEQMEENENENENANENEKEVVDETKTATTTNKAPRAKRVKAAKPEYFEDKRNLEDLWKAVFPVGTEWDLLDSVYKYNWNFKNLEDAFEEGGKLYGQKVYLWGCTEPQMVMHNEVLRVICVPVVVAVVSPFPPSDKIGINSVQREAEEIVPMKQMKMDWVPYIPLENRDRQVERLKSQIYILSCTQRRTALRHLKLDRVKKYEYCLPYFYQPLKEDELDQSTVVDIMFPSEPPIVCDFDWELDDLEEFTDDRIREEQLSEEQKDAFKDFVKEKVREAKKANREAREARKKAIEEMSPETKVAFENMKFYKFYPVQTPDTPEISKKSLYLNRYYGKAHEYL